MKAILFFCAPLLAAAASFKAVSHCPSKKATPTEQRVIFDSFIKTLYTESKLSEAYDAHVAENLIQHSPELTSGRKATVDGLAPFLAMLNITVALKGLSDGIGWVYFKETDE